MSFYRLAAFLAAVASCLVLSSHAALSSDEKTELLRAHNYYRSKAKPTPTDMVALEWDDELAALGQFWAVSCTMEANENRHEQSLDYDYVGEIMYGTANYTVNMTSMVFEWFMEGINYDYSQRACLNENGEAGDDLDDCVRYLQLMWAQTYKVGCGSYKCEEIEGWENENEDQVDDGQKPLLVVCNYGPGGAFAEVSPYQSGGEACSACPNKYSGCENNLCIEESGAISLHQLSLTMLLLFTSALYSLI